MVCAVDSEEIKMISLCKLLCRPGKLPGFLLVRNCFAILREVKKVPEMRRPNIFFPQKEIFLLCGTCIFMFP